MHYWCLPSHNSHFFIWAQPLTSIWTIFIHQKYPNIYRIVWLVQVANGLHLTSFVVIVFAIYPSRSLISSLLPIIPHSRFRFSSTPSFHQSIASLNPLHCDNRHQLPSTLEFPSLHHCLSFLHWFELGSTMSDAKQPQKRPEYEVIPDNSTSVPPAGTVERIKGAKDQFHAFQVYSKLYVRGFWRFAIWVWVQVNHPFLSSFHTTSYWLSSDPVVVWDLARKGRAW